MTSQVPPTFSVYYIPYIRSVPVEFFGTNLRPFTKANFFFDDTNISDNIQVASQLRLNSAPIVFFGEGLYSSSTKGYGTVIGVSGDNRVQLNENFLRLQISPIGVETLTAGDYSKKDTVFQSKNNSGKSNQSTFLGSVEYWNHTDGVLVVRPIDGTANTISGGNNIYKVSGNKTCTVQSTISSNAFASNSTVTSTRDALKSYQVTNYEHRSSHVTGLGANNRLIRVSSNAQNIAVGTSINIITGKGSANKRIVVSSPNSNTVFINSDVVGITGIAKYSLGDPIVNQFGDLSGIFTIPETPKLRFKSGEKLFTITDANSVTSNTSTMKSSAQYIARGLYDYWFYSGIKFAGKTLSTTTAADWKLFDSHYRKTPFTPPVPTNILVDPNKLTPQPPVLRTDRFTEYGLTSNNTDPLAQTFFTPKPPNRITADGITATDYGTFVTSVDLFFRRKPIISLAEPQLPVSVKIVETVNGIPGSRILAYSSVSCDKVNVADGVNKLPNINDDTTKTRFSFKDPIYLQPNTEYAIVIETDSPAYDVWIAELSKTAVNDFNNKRVSEQPYAGKFYRSQNASVWTPYENQDLMFSINRAFFNSNQVAYVGGSVTLNFNVPSEFGSNYGIDSVVLRSDDISFPVAPISYSIQTTLDRTLEFDSSPTVIQPNEAYNFAAGSNTSITTTGRRRTILAGNANSFIISVTMDTKDESVSPVFGKDTFSLITSTNLINNGQLDSEDITIISGGLHTNSSNVIVNIGPSTLFPNDESARAKANVISSGIVGNTIVAINVYDGGRGYVESPTITITDSSSSSNAVAQVNSEDRKYGGNGLARFVTKKVTLADGFDAGDLRVFMNAVRPQGTNIIVYYKVLSDSDPDRFEDKNWKRMALENDLVSPDLITAYDFVYRPSLTSNDLSYVENGISYPVGGRFKYFAIKILMLAECGCVPPTIKNLRIIALPEESKKD